MLTFTVKIVLTSITAGRNCGAAFNTFTSKQEGCVLNSQPVAFLYGLCMSVPV